MIRHHEKCECSSDQQPACANWRMGRCKDKPMPSGTVRFLALKENPGNGAPAAMRRAIGGDVPSDVVDGLLIRLWMEGYMVVPVELLEAV